MPFLQGFLFRTTLATVGRRLTPTTRVGNMFAVFAESGSAALLPKAASRRFSRVEA